MIVSANISHDLRGLNCGRPEVQISRLAEELPVAGCTAEPTCPSAVTQSVDGLTAIVANSPTKKNVQIGFVLPFHLSTHCARAWATEDRGVV